MAEALTNKVISHALEEGRHALGLKHMALKIGGEAFETYQAENMLCGNEAEAYFQRLDAACDKVFAGHPDALRTKLVYYYVTWLVERRALKVYGAHHNALELESSSATSGIAALFREEKKHLSEVEIAANDPEFLTRASELEVMEQRFYDTLVDALFTDLAKPKAPVATFV